MYGHVCHRSDAATSTPIAPALLEDIRHLFVGMMCTDTTVPRGSVSGVVTLCPCGVRLPPLAAYTGLLERSDDFVAEYRGDGVLSIPVILKRMMIFVQVPPRKITTGRLFSWSHMVGAIRSAPWCPLISSCATRSLASAIEAAGARLGRSNSCSLVSRRFRARSQPANPDPLASIQLPYPWLRPHQCADLVPATDARA
jgi:hypothetical protein